MTQSRAVQIASMFCLLPGCWWHEGIDPDIKPTCVTVGWSEGRVRVDEVMDQQAGWGETCVPLQVGDEFVVRRAAKCHIGVFSGDPTPEFIEPYAPYCRLEAGPGFVCRERELDGGHEYTGVEVVVEFVGNTLIVDWDQPAAAQTPEIKCKQEYRVSFISTSP